MLEIYKNIKQKRYEMGWTQSDLAKKIGYSNKSMIARIEAGDVDLTQSKILKFAEVFGCTPSELMGSGENLSQKLNEFIDKLNEAGMEKLIERAEELSELPKYRRI